MGFFTRKETLPRRLICPHCAEQVDAGATAQSIVCRNCNTTVSLADQVVTQYVALVTLETCGALVVEKRGALVLQRRCYASSLTVRGSLKGHAIVHGTARLEAGAQMTGDLTARSVIIDPGATLKGVLTILKQ